MIYGYARVSSPGQERYGNGLNAQEEQLRAAGATVIYREAFTGTKAHRPQLDALFSVLQAGDTVVVAKLDRIARSVKDGISIIEKMQGMDVTINVLNMGRFDNTPTGRLMRNIMLAFAEFERDLIVQRTNEGKAVVKQNNPDYKEGRKAVQYDSELFESLYSDVLLGALSVTDAAERLGVSRAKWYRIVKERSAA